VIERLEIERVETALLVVRVLVNVPTQGFRIANPIEAFL
jgi:hypothetical protein